MNIVSWNVNGIRAVEKKELFSPMLHALSPDILLLQETKATEEQSPLDLPEYHKHWHSAEKKGYSGVALFSKEEPLAVLSGMPERLVKKYSLASDSYGNPNEEGRIIAAEYNDFFVVGVYTPNAKEDLSRLPLRHKHWDPAFLAYIKELERKKPVVVGGDLNVAHTEDDLARPKENKGVKGFTTEEREGIQALIDAGFVDSFREFHEGNGHYTWWSHFRNARERNVGWRIDYLLASKALLPKIKNAAIHKDLLGSDHCPISLEIAP